MKSRCYKKIELCEIRMCGFVQRIVTVLTSYWTLYCLVTSFVKSLYSILVTIYTHQLDVTLFKKTVYFF